jgi:hypothetical protein
MARPWGHSPGYHAWPSSTPVIDAIGTVLAVASVVIGSYAALFLSFALSSGDADTAVDDALFFVAIGLANGGLETLRRWRRHHG